MNVAVVHRIDPDDMPNGSPPSPFAMQPDVRWDKINAQRAAARTEWLHRARDVAAGPDLPMALPPLWP